MELFSIATPPIDAWLMPPFQQRSKGLPSLAIRVDAGKIKRKTDWFLPIH
jgi:hypothetical protein